MASKPKIFRVVRRLVNKEGYICGELQMYALESQINKETDDVIYELKEDDLELDGVAHKDLKEGPLVFAGFTRGQVGIDPPEED